MLLHSLSQREKTMAKNNHLYTVYHSLDNSGAFDEPVLQNGINQDQNTMQGKYWQEKTEYPKYLHSNGLKSVIVGDKEEELKVLSLWEEQKNASAQADEIHNKNKAEITKAELVDRARKLGIKVDGRASEKKLAYLIEEAELANENKVA